MERFTKERLLYRASNGPRSLHAGGILSVLSGEEQRECEYVYLGEGIMLDSHAGQ